VAWADEAAFSAFYGRTSRAIWAYVYRTTGNATDADDIVQDAFCRLVAAPVEELGDEERRRYVFRIATNLMNDRWRRAARERSWLESVSGLTRGGETLRRDDTVESTFGGLKPRERALLWLAYVEEDDHQQIAETLGLARGSVKVLLSRARGRLRDLLKSRGIVGGGHG
jgi:RNA polymerase sigma-70 factor (ECF subfamily)